MKKNISAIIAVLFALCSLACAAYTYVDASRTLAGYLAQLEDLTAQNENLRAQLDLLAVRAESAAASIGVDMEAWDLSAAAWDDASGADLTLTVVPTAYREDISANLQVYLAGELAADIPCVWNGTEFTATAALPAANGYRYLLNLGDTYFELNDATAVNLADSLASYCNLVITDWNMEDNSLTITGCYAQVQLPTIAPSGLDLAVQEAALVLRCSGAEVSRQAVVLGDGEAAGSYETDGTLPALTLPELTDGDVLELQLEVTLNDGRQLFAWGGSWLYTGSVLEMAAG